VNSSKLEDFSSSTTALVLFPPIPTTKGNLPAFAFTTVFLISSFSSLDKVADSAVVPKTTR